MYDEPTAEQPAEQPAAQAEEQDLYGQWEAQSPEQPQASSDQPEDDFLAGLNLYDEPTAEQPAAQSEEEALFSQWEAQSPEQPQATSEQPDSEQPEEDDFFASLTPYNEHEQSAAQTEEEDLFGQWEDQSPEQAQTDDQPQEDDFFASLGMDVDDEPLLNNEPTSDTPDDDQPSEADLFAQWDSPPQAEAEADELPPEDDFFASLGMDAPEDDSPVSAQPDQAQAEQAQPEQAQPEENPFANWDAQPVDTLSEAQAAEALFEWDTDKEVPPEEDFFNALGMMGEADQQTEPTVEPQPPREDFLGRLGKMAQGDKVIGDAPTSISPPSDNLAADPAVFDNVDSYLASLSSDQPEVKPDTDKLFNKPDPNVDMDNLFADLVLGDKPADSSTKDTIPGVNEDWLAELQSAVSVGDVSAAAIVRQKQDRPVEELPERLKKLRQRAEQIPEDTPKPKNDALTDVLPGVSDALTPAPFVAGSLTLAQGVILSAEQQHKVDLLKALIPAAEEQPKFRMSAIEATYNSPFMPDLEDTPESSVVPEKVQAPARVRTRRRLRINIRIDRFFVAVLLALALILPFLVPALRVGTLPPSSFAAGSPAQSAFDQINAVEPGTLVLVGIEYGPTSAAELDGMTDAVLRHILLRAAFPVIIGGNPVGVLRAENLFAAINADSAFLQRIGASAPLQANKDYYIVRYLPGSVIGLRAFSQDTANLLLSDIRGQTSGLNVRSLRDFGLISVITDRPEDLRAYAEQIAPLTHAPLLAAVNYGSAPLAEPYASALGGGLLVGYRDAYTYDLMLGLAPARSISEQIYIAPTDEPAQAAATDEFGQPISPNGTSGAPGIGFATVTSSAAVNMRGGPGTNNPVLAAVASGVRVEVLGFDALHAWVNVQLTDGREGWISSALLSVELSAPDATQSSSVPKDDVYGKRRVQVGDARKPRLQTGDQPTADATPEPASEAAATDEAAATLEAGAALATAIAPTGGGRSGAVFTLPLTFSEGYRDERWYSMTLGIIVSVLIISFGTVVNLIRGLLRRGRRG